MSNEKQARKAASRVYVVTRMDDNSMRLVEAISPSQALKHVTASTHTVVAATPKDVMKAMALGVKPETARDDHETLPLDL